MSGRHCKHCTKRVPKHANTNSIQADRRTSGSRTTSIAFIRIDRVSMNGMQWTRLKVGVRRHRTPFETSEFHLKISIFLANLYIFVWFTCRPTAREETERIIRTALKEIILQLDLDEVTSKYIRTRLEEHLDMNLTEYKSFIDQEMLTILGQLDAPTKIFDHVYLGSEWNASNLEELQRNGVRHILNVTREIDNFFPGMFDYFNVRVYDDEKTNLLKHWDNTFKYITQAKNDGSKVLVHCKMGVSRSASVVIAYAMKAYGLSYREAFEHVKQNRSCVKPNKNFVSQLETYQGMLAAMKNKEKLQRSKSDTNLRSTKDARLLPGSEPTPLIQALDAAAKKEEEESNRFQSRAVASSNRPKSWSPDSVEAAILLPKQLSQSMENLPPERVESDDWEAKNNVRLPCKNGQNYSVSQNQVFHLDAHKSSVKLIVNELESHQKRLKEAKAKQANSREDNWDPGDKISPETIRRNLAPTGQLSSTVPNVCDKNFNTGSGPVTKALSHDSPFGSLRRSESIKARISSDASPVMKSRSLDANTSTKLNKSPVFRHSAPEDARPVPFPGWTRRCASFNTSPNQQTIVSRSASSLSNSSSSSTVSLSGGGVNNPTNQSPSDLINNLGPKNVKNLCNSFAMREKHAQKGTGGGASERQVPEIRIDASKRNSDSSFVNMAIARFADQFSKDFMQCIKKRCKSDETLYESADIMSTVNKRLSASSPSDYSPTHFNDKTPFLSRPTFIWSSHRASPIAKNVANAAKARRAKSRATCRTVENLKLNFESRESDGSDAKDVKRGRSLPSSPSASIYVNTANVNTSDPTSKLNCDKIGYEEINVKGLVDRYEVTKLKNDQTSPLFNNFSAQLKRTQQKFAAAAAGDNSRTNIVHPKPPPIPHTANVQTKPANNILLAKRMQHENQSFANIRQHFNSPSAYNTM